ncbi:MAG TPA: oligosaccharide flippase family protein [Candidatus Eisenbacteria bacterium]|nr:oligosaccharide flippase family protein [Candidatus Eisenbacteria bacterium]
MRDSIGYAFAQYFVRATLMVRGLVAARFLGPEAWGSWNAIQLLMDSAPLAGLGTQQGLDQAVPPAIVAGDPVALDRVKRAALFNTVLLTGGFVVACLLAMAYGGGIILHSWGYLGIGAAAVCIFTTNLAYYQSSIMRSHGNIGTASGWLLIQGGVGASLGLLLLPGLHVWGLLAGWMAGCLAAFAFSIARSRAHAPLAPRPATESLELLQVGFPMYVFNVSSKLLMRMLDRLVILHYFNLTALGYYSLSATALALLMNIPDSITFVMYPRLLRQFSEGGRDIASIRPRVERVLWMFAVILPPVCGVAYLCSQPAVVLLLPGYAPGVTAMKVLCFGAVGLAFAGFASIVLMTLGRQRMMIPAALAGLAIYAGFDVFAARTWHTITSVAWATLLAYATHSIVVLALALLGLGMRDRRLITTMTGLHLPLALALVLSIALDRFLPWADRPGVAWTLARLGTSLVAFVAAYLAVLYPAIRGTGMLEAISELDLPAISPLARRLVRERRGRS